METLRGFPNLPAFWFRRAKLGCANAISPHNPRFGARACEKCGLAHQLRRIYKK
jgi:hypothetical protein